MTLSQFSAFIHRFTVPQLLIKEASQVSHTGRSLAEVRPGTGISDIRHWQPASTPPAFSSALPCGTFHGCVLSPVTEREYGYSRKVNSWQCQVKSIPTVIYLFCIFFFVCLLVSHFWGEGYCLPALSGFLPGD